MCMCIGANYSAICKPILFICGTLIGLYVPHKILKFQVDISNSFLSYLTACVPTLG